MEDSPRRLEKGLLHDDTPNLRAGPNISEKPPMIPAGQSEDTVEQGQRQRIRLRSKRSLVYVLGLFSLAYILGRNFFWLILNPTPKDGPDIWYDVPANPAELFNDSQVLNENEIPQYVFDHAPLVHLFSEEQFWPCDIAEHLLHVTPKLNYTPISGKLQYSNLTNLDQLNQYEKGHHVFLTSNDNVEERPDWLGGHKNIPEQYGNGEKEIQNAVPRRRSTPGKARMPSQGGHSSAPAVLITVDKGNGVLDAFWFYFYSYNLGNIVINIRWGNHVGDWEHSLVRFHNGHPKLVFFSEHSFGAAYTYDAVEKIGRRPVVYSAVGTHAMYATPGPHPYILPLGLLHDATDRGPLWDPALNCHTYTYSPPTDTLLPSNHTPAAPVEWFYFAGHWGDKLYPLNDHRQYGLVGEYHYVNGPLGPRFKHLGRAKVCQGRDEDPCVIRQWLEEEGEDVVVVAPGVGEGEDWPDEEEKGAGGGIGMIQGG